jgi:hypothetical protein
MDRAVDDQAEHETVGENAGAAEHAPYRYRAELGEQVADEFGVHAGNPFCLFVMPGHSRSKNGVASLAYVPGIHVSTALPI